MKRRVGLISLGDHLSINVSKLARRLNRVQTYFRFEDAGQVPTLGSPTVDDKYYDVQLLFETLRQHSAYPAYDFVLGVTREHITEPTEARSLPEKDYFSLSDGRTTSVITEAMAEYNSPRKDVYRYAAYLLTVEIATNLAGAHMLHGQSKLCLFDDCCDRLVFRRGIEKSILCDSCRGKLQTQNVEGPAVAAIDKLLRFCRRNSLTIALRDTFRSPAVSLIVGSALGWFLRTYVPSEYWIAVLTTVVVVALAVFFWKRYRR
jgi:hypothetical protein